jgi:hypothetical protein
VGVDHQVHAASGSCAGHAFQALDDARLDPVLWQACQGLCGQMDVAHGLDVQQSHQERLELRLRHVCHATA